MNTTASKAKSPKNPVKSPRLQSCSDLLQIAGSIEPKSVVIAGGDRTDDIALVESARDHGIIDRCILVGDGDRIREATRELGVPLEKDNIVRTKDQEETARRTIEIVNAGEADIILKGNISTPILNRKILEIKVRDTISLVTLFDSITVSDGKPILLTDPGVSTICDYKRMSDLIINSVDVAKYVCNNHKPRVALLSANEKIIKSLESTVLAKQLTESQWKNMTVYGPLSFDLAVDPESVRMKGIVKKKESAVGKVAGHADILVCPGLDCANAIYKMVMGMVRYGIASMAGITVGVKVPYIILSRSDLVETKLDSIALCCIYAENAKRDGV